MYLDQAKKAEIFGQYGKDTKDTGSVESQVALFTYRIQRTSGTEVLVVLLQVLGEVLNTIGEQCYLALNRTGVLSVLAILAEDLSLLS